MREIGLLHHKTIAKTPHSHEYLRFEVRSIESCRHSFQSGSMAKGNPFCVQIEKVKLTEAALRRLLWREVDSGAPWSV